MQLIQNIARSFLLFAFLSFGIPVLAQHPQGANEPAATPNHGAAAGHASGGHEEMSYNEVVMDHISNSNEFHVFGDLHIPLPVMVYAPDKSRESGGSSLERRGRSQIR